MENTYRRPPRREVRGRAGGKRPVTAVTEYDGVIMAVVFVLVLVGLIMVFSSSYYLAMRQGRSMFHYFISQSRAALLGVVAMFVMSKVSYRTLGGLTVPLYLFSVGLFVYTGLFGREVNNARRWLDIPLFGQFQTVELMKLALILFLAFMFSKYPGMLKSWLGIGIAAVFTLVPALIGWQLTNSLASGIILAAIGFGMIFVASPFLWRFLGLLVIAVTGGVAFLSGDDGHQGRRFATFFDPFGDPLGTGYQTIQGLYAVASGGLFGLGLGNSRQKLMYMVEPHNDFIFAILAEELGFVGASIVIFLFCVLIWRGVRVAMYAADLLGTLVATGIVVMITVQAIINIGVVTNTIPTTGVPMPFISFGGSSILFLLAMVGILLNISRYMVKNN